MRKSAWIVLCVFTATAHADEGVALDRTLAVGARIGGYGFREPAAEGSGASDWRGCRMNGVGLFAQRDLTPRFFVEAGLDAYFTDEQFVEGEEAEAEMDRVSGLATAAGGVRFFPGAVVSPYAQVGLGLEATRVTHAGTAAASYLLPVGFIGIGGDLHIGRLALGTSLRLHGMSVFEAEDVVDGEPTPRAALAAQVQFYALFAP